MSGEQDPVLFGMRGDPQWAALSNFHPTPIVVDGRTYPTAEHYYQACKAATDEGHEMVRAAPTPAQAKKCARQLPRPPNWDRERLEVMRVALLAKFRQHPDLRALLLSTGERPIHEAAPHDATWGWLDGRGQDLLGRLLMEVRAQLRQEETAG